MGVVLEVDTVSVAVPGAVLVIVMGDPVKEQVGAGVPPVMLLHETLTLPV
jgi:hypothetical protein